VTVDPAAIPWLLLQAVPTSECGIFAGTTYIQRVRTTGGLAPTDPPTQAGEEARVPYTAEYVFYQARSKAHKGPQEGRQGHEGEACPPAVPKDLWVPADNHLSLHVHATGVQIYKATPSPADPAKFDWTFAAPEADLFADPDYEELIGTHYAGPTWESTGGSKVVGTRVAGVTVHPAAIPWLLLQAVSTSGRGVFACTTYIQRVKTAGGLAPSTPPTQAGEEARVPYTAEYFFYQE
jgi:hypothetical protein